MMAVTVTPGAALGAVLIAGAIGVALGLWIAYKLRRGPKHRARGGHCGGHDHDFDTGGAGDD